jgi:4-hydroxy-3-polyprenylbenzoate decarboxylase
MKRRAVLAITGASGAIYGARMLRTMAGRFDVVYACVSRHGMEVLTTELGIAGTCPRDAVAEILDGASDRVHVLDPDDYFTPPASGSARHEGMVIAPCSTGTAGRIAAGVSTDLITRAADVCLKERRPLVLVVRETPLNVIQLRNLTRLAESGAVVMPACPAFYHRPETIEDLVDTVVERALTHLCAEIGSGREWQVDRA